MQNGWTKRIEELEAEVAKLTGDLPPMQLTDDERRDGHSALRWNKGKQAIETFDPHPSVGLTDDERKMLTEYLGECWHEVSYKEYRYVCKCGKEDDHQNSADPMAVIRGFTKEHSGRTFTTPADLHAVYSAMVRKGEWEEFEALMWEKWPDVGSFKHGIAKYAAWLFCLAHAEQIPERMKMVCTLIGRQ